MKSLSVILTAAIAIVICFVGLQLNNKRQYDQRVAYAKTAVEAEQNKLEKLQQQVDELYTNEKKALCQIVLFSNINIIKKDFGSSFFVI